MRKDYEIRWSKEASEQLDSLIDYLDAEWGTTVTDKFLTHLEEVLSSIASFPFSGVSAKHKPFHRKITVTTQNTLYYGVYTNDIIIKAIFDTRQNPSKLKIR